MKEPHPTTPPTFHHPIATFLFISRKSVRYSKIKHSIFSIICFVAVLWSTEVLYDHLVFEVAEFKTVYGFYSGISLVPAITALIQSLILPHCLPEIVDRIDSVLLASGIDLNLLNTEHNFFNVINHNILQTLFSFIALIASRFLNRPFYTTTALNIVVMILSFYKHYVILQCVYLIEMSKLNLCLLSKRMLEHKKLKKLNEHQMITVLAELKVMHLNVWEIIHRINSHYGWTFIAMFFEAFINASRATYILIILFYDFEGSRQKVLRKYYLLNRQFFCSLLKILFFGIDSFSSIFPINQNLSSTPSISDWAHSD